MMYAAGNYYRGAYKKPHWGLEHPAPVGAWGKGKKHFPSNNPANGETLAKVAQADETV